MKVLQINYGLGRGGAETFLIDLSNQLSINPNNEVVFLSVYDKSVDKFAKIKDLSDDIRWISAGAKSGLSLKSVMGILIAIIKEKPDVVHLHSNVMLLFLPAFFYRKPKYIHTLHSSAERCLRGRLMKFLGKFLYSKNFVQPVTISKDSHQSFIKYLGINNDICIPNGIASIIPTHKMPVVREELKHLGIIPNSDVPLFIHVARHHPIKNHRRLFRSFERLEQENIPFQLLVIGDNYDEYKSIYDNHKSIHLIGVRDNVADYLLYADYFVLTSDMEGLPITLLEAMSVGVIPICTPAGGINSVIRDGINGYKSEYIDDESYYQTIKRALSECGKVKRNQIIEDFNNFYSINRCLEQYYQIYKGEL